MSRTIPTWLSHTPVVAIDYEKKDEESGAGDAKWLSLGRSTWNKEDFSAKVFRWAEDGQRWSRQSEELTFWRLLDLTILLLSRFVNNPCDSFDPIIVNPQEAEALDDFLKENIKGLEPRINELRSLLTQHNDIPQTSIPNIFSFATSELSQDAMLAWLINCADSSANHDQNLQNVATDFVRMLLERDSSFQINKVVVGRQWKNIDVWAIINDDIFLTIEDKTNTTIHSNQLERYRESVQQEFGQKCSQLCFAYVKTGNEPISITNEVEKSGYVVILRQAIIKCLEKYDGTNPLIISYLEYLNKIQKQTESFKDKPVREWDKYAWEGFFQEIEKPDHGLKINSWSYVPNKSGGFMCAYWISYPIGDKTEIYLQFEEQKLCFKICYDGDSSKRSQVRTEHHNRLMRFAKDEGFTEIEKPDRFGAGTWMTIAIVKPENLFGTGKFDKEHLNTIIQKLKQYQDLIIKYCDPNQTHGQGNISS